MNKTSLADVVLVIIILVFVVSITSTFYISSIIDTNEESKPALTSLSGVLVFIAIGSGIGTAIFGFIKWKKIL
jgi:formate hydrogenlyase subunit 3/multisubunit Na+/H+ antiporter MnhD subunit